MKAAVLLQLVALSSGCATFKQYPFNQDLPGNPVCLFENVCVKYTDQEHKILHREFFFPGKDVAKKLWHDYEREYEYIEKRRVQSGRQKADQARDQASPRIPPTWQA